MRERRGRFALIFAGICAVLIAIEARLVFYDRLDTFGIEGQRRLEADGFAAGEPITHAFLMRGDGLESVSLLFSSRTATTARVQWSFWRGYPDVPSEMTLAYEETQDLELRPGRQWRTLTVPREGSSRDRWYTIQVRLAEPQPAAAPQVSVIVSGENPDRGGVLWINNVRQPGSLVMRAARRGRTLYRQFRMESEPHLPPFMRLPAVQWGLVLLCHGAAMIFAYALLADARAARDSAPR